MDKYDMMKGMDKFHPDREICGFIMNDGSGDVLLPIHNVHHSPQHNFSMHHEMQNRTLNAFLPDITGMFHSHHSGDPKPSLGDIDAWPEFEGSEGWDYFIISDGEIWEWHLDEDREPYGRQVA